MFPQEAIPSGVNGENLHQNNPYHYYPSMPTHPHPIMPPHPHHHMTPHLYTIITPQQVCLYPYLTYTPMNEPYIVPQYLHIPSLGYLHTSSGRLPYYVLPPH